MNRPIWVSKSNPLLLFRQKSLFVARSTRKLLHNRCGKIHSFWTSETNSTRRYDYGL